MFKLDSFRRVATGFTARHLARVENEAAMALYSLGSDWKVFRASYRRNPLGADFVVVGPAGVFAITTNIRPHSRLLVGEELLLVNGFATDHVDEARNAALVVASGLMRVGGEVVSVIPVIAVSDPTSIQFVGEDARRVIVLPTDILARWLVETARTNSDAAIDFYTLVVDEMVTAA